jgi:hypothetical protein
VGIYELPMFNLFENALITDNIADQAKNSKPDERFSKNPYTRIHLGSTKFIWNKKRKPSGPASWDSTQ